MNKKGAEMTIGTIVIIILALVVLVILIYGFSVGWGNLWENILGLGGGKVNVQTIIQGCQVQCTTGSQYEYCYRPRAVTFERVGGKKNPLDKPDYTCKQLEEISQVGLASCTTIACATGNNLLGKTCFEWSQRQWQTNCNINTINPELSEIDIGPERFGLISTTDRNQNANKKCCVPKKDCTAWRGTWQPITQCDLTTTYDINPELITTKDVTDHGGQKCCANA